MTHSVGRQSGAPFVSGPGATNNVTTNFTGGPWTFIQTHVDSSAETLATFRLDEDTSSSLKIVNTSATNGVFAPVLRGTQSGTTEAITLQGVCTTDTGTNPGIRLQAYTAASAVLTTRPIFDVLNYGATVLSFLPLNSGANGALSWGTQTAGAPAFTTRSAGTRLILLSNIGGSTVDYGIGYESSHVWLSCEAAQNARGFKWYGGTTLLGRFSGDGIFSLGTNTTNYSRLGQKLEANTSANYGGAALNTWSTTAGERTLIDINRSKSATVGTHAVVASGDSLGDIVWRGSDGTAFIDGAGILAAVDGTPGTNDMPTRLIFQTTPDGSASRTERMRITNAGDIGIGKTPTTGIILDVGGQLGLKSYTVATLPSASVQAGAIVYASDAGGNGPCLVISNGTNWKRCDNTSTTVS